MFNTSFLVKITFAYLYALEKRPNGAIEWYNKAVELVPNYPLMHYGTRYLLGEIYWFQCNWEVAKPYCVDYLTQTSSKYLRCMANFKIGVCNWMLKQKDDVESYLQAAEENVKEHFDHDAYALRFITKYKSNGNMFTKYDEYLIIINNLIEIASYDNALEILQKFKLSLEKEEDLENENAFELKCWSNYFHGLILSGKKEYDIALEVFLTQIISLEIELKERYMFYIVPCSVVEIADIYLKMNEEEEAIKMYKKGKNYTNYAFEKYLNYRIVRALESIKDISKPEDN